MALVDANIVLRYILKDNDPPGTELEKNYWGCHCGQPLIFYSIGNEERIQNTGDSRQKSG